MADWGLAASGIGGGLEGWGNVQQSSQTTENAKAGLGQAGSNNWQAVGQGIQGIGGLLLMIAGVFLTMGFAMAFLVPLVPFMTFFFGVMTWVVAMLEAVIAAPLVALAHLNPEGAGLPGDMARGAYFIIFQVFLRPVLMVFGLLCGLLIFYIAVSFLNAMFAIAVGGTGGLSHGHSAITRLIYTVIYVLLVVSAANHSFVMITRLPDTALQWMGASGLQGASMGNLDKLIADTQAVQAIITNQAMPQLGQGAAKVGSGIGFAGHKATGIMADTIKSITGGDDGSGGSTKGIGGSGDSGD